MAESTAHKLAIIPETVMGSTPEDPQFQRLPDTRTTLALTKDNLETERNNGTRFPAIPRTGAESVGGEIPADLSYSTYDLLFASALQGLWVNDEVKVSDVRQSFSVLREFSDIKAAADDVAKPFFLYKGCEVSTMAIAAAANGLVKATFGFFGRTMDDPAASAPAGTTYLDAVETEPFDTFSGDLLIDGTPVCIVTDLNLNLNNGHAARYAVGRKTKEHNSGGGYEEEAHNLVLLIITTTSSWQKLVGQRIL